MASTTMMLVLASLLASVPSIRALQVVLAGGTGTIGQGVAALLAPTQHQVILLSRNSFLAATPDRVTRDFGWVGARYLKKFPHVSIRDWDGGDLLDIVGSDWLGWQEDVLLPRTTDSVVVVVHLTGGFTDQRIKATERLVREGLRVNPPAVHITVSPTLEELPLLSPGLTALKESRIQQCEQLVAQNCQKHECVRIAPNEVAQSCQAIVDCIQRLAVSRE
jgi:lysophospholipase L1-like esterase